MFNSNYCDEYGRYILTDKTSDKAEQALNVLISIASFTEGNEESLFKKLCTFLDFDKVGICDEIFTDTVRAYAIKLASKMCPTDCTLEWDDTFLYRLAYYKKYEN